MLSKYYLRKCWYFCDILLTFYSIVMIVFVFVDWNIMIVRRISIYVFAGFYNMLCYFQSTACGNQALALVLFYVTMLSYHNLFSKSLFLK